MQLAIIENGQITRLGHYKELFPNTSFPSTGADSQFMRDNSCLEVTVWKPTTELQKLVSCEPYIDGQYVYTVRVEDKTQDELNADKLMLENSIRATRNKLLSDCDWTQVLDAPVDKQAWANYRQALRDVTSQSGFPFDVTYPIAPLMNGMADH
jgi:hypothetical protein